MYEEIRKEWSFVEDFTNTMEVLTWKAVAIDWRQGLTNPW